MGVLLVAACGGSVASSPADGADAAIGADARVPIALDAGGAGDAPIEAARDAAHDAPADAPKTGDDAGSCDPGPDVPSRQTVRLVVTNQAAADRYLVTQGNLCDPYSLSFSQQGALPLQLGFQCLCECPNPGPARPAALHRLAAGDSFTITWDARSLRTCTASVDCASMGWTGMGSASELMGASEPVGAGLYWVTVAALTAVPTGCSSGDGTTFNCPMSWGGGGPGPSFPSAIQTMCPADVSGGTSFQLAASGDVSVPIAITK